MVKDSELSLLNILQILGNKIVFIVVAVGLGASIAAVITLFLIAPKYTATVSMYVYNNPNRQEATLNDINMSVQLVDTYIVILNSDTLLKEVAAESGLGYSVKALKSMISASSVNNTEVFQVDVTSENPAHARIIADTIAQVAPKEIMRVVKAGSVEIIDGAQKEPPQTSPNNWLNILIGAFLGFILALMVIFGELMFDKTVKSEKELAAIFGLPVLGTVPRIDRQKVEA